jgi:SET domain-containing protein
MAYILTDFDPHKNKRCQRYSTCKEYTSRSPYCPSCLFSIWGVGIGPSHAFDKRGNHAGLGLFALKPFTQGEFICHYDGRKVLHDATKASNSYLMYFNKDYSIDAQNPYSCIGRYINGSSPEHKLKANVYSYINSRKRKVDNVSDTNIMKPGRPFNLGKIGIYAKYDINIGEELFISYGSGYWSKHHRQDQWNEEYENSKQNKQRLPAQPDFKKIQFTRSDIQ